MTTAGTATVDAAALVERFRGTLVFSHAKGVLRRATRPDPDLAYPPYTASKERLLRRFL